MTGVEIIVVGGIYLEQCMRPHWNDYFGSGGRAALALGRMSNRVSLHGYADREASTCLEIRHANMSDVSLSLTPINTSLCFSYTHGLATPRFGKPSSEECIELKGDNILRFGMLEGEAVVQARQAVYDPQNPHNPRPFKENGSKAERLAIVLNRNEARLLLGDDAHDEDEKTVELLAEREGAEIVVMKRGPRGALVYEAGELTIVPAYKTRRVWKVGSGDVFAAVFAMGWMKHNETAHDAAMRASKATAFYCENRTPPTIEQLKNFNPCEIEIGARWTSGESFSAYLAGPFFNLAQLWLVEEAKHALSSMQLKVLSPYHEVGVGPAMDVAPKDLEMIRNSDVVLALCDGFDPGTLFEVGYARSLGIPVVVFSEIESAENLKMMEGSGCIICDDFVSSIYHAMWAISDE